VTVTVTDDDGASTSDTLRVTVNNVAPVAVNDSYLANEDLVLATVKKIPGLLLNDIDVPADSLTAALVIGPTLGKVELKDDGSFVYTPKENLYGVDTFTYQVTDDDGAVSNTGTVSITVRSVNDAPSFTGGPGQEVAEDSGEHTVEKWATEISAGPANEAKQTLNFVVSNDNPELFKVQPAVSIDGTLTFAAAADAFGTATIMVMLKDNGGTARGGVDTSAPHTFVINVLPVNDSPSFTAGASRTVAEDAGLQTVANWASAISAGPANEANQALSFTVTNDNTTLFLTQPAVAVDGTLTYRSASNKYGSATVSVVLKDNGGTNLGGVNTSAPQTFSIMVNPVNDAPKGDAQELSTNEDQGLEGRLTATDVDNKPEELTFGLYAEPANGLVEVASNGEFRYRPKNNYFGQDSFGFTVSDRELTSKEAFVTIDIVPVNDAPVAVDDNFSTNEDVALTVPAPSLLANDTDVDGDALSVTGVSNAVNGTVSLVGGNPVFTPAGNFYGAGSFSYVISDGLGGTDTGLVAVTINPVNDRPVARSDEYMVPAEGILVVDAKAGVLANDTDVDDSRLTAVRLYPDEEPSYGRLELNP
jgi:VCBS repeat-containing protein